MVRTLGAKASTIRGILYAEYSVLAFIGVFSGLVFALLGGMILSYYVLEMPLVLPWLKIIGICLSLGLLVALGGIIGSFGTIRRPALQSFRMLEG
jgi:predicted lysophospholipase L1 biosynthesis ABC-type transport system permease subunit